ncbi:MAG: hypothetical protein AAGK78_07125 [Planctomycetota bacterium]
MFSEDDAKATYAAGKRFLAALGDRKHGANEIGWACDDLEEALLDLKVAVLEDELDYRSEYVHECVELVRLIRRLLDDEPLRG